MDYFEEAKKITRAAWPTYKRIQSLTGPKPICRHCFVTCDWRSREYRALRLCPWCYLDAPIIIQKKESKP